MHRRIRDWLYRKLFAVVGPHDAADAHAGRVAGFRLRLGAVLFSRECLRLVFVWLVIWSVAGVGLRAAFRIERTTLLWGLVGVAAMLVAAVVLATRKLPSVAALRAAVDRHAELGGLLMSAADADIGVWRERISSLSLPAVRWRSRRQFVPLLAGIVFLAAAFLMPDRYLPGEGSSLQIGGDIQKLAAKVQLLRQEQILRPEKAEVLEKNLQRAREEASGRDPAKTMEAMDHLEQSLAKAAAEAAQASVKKAESQSRIQELAQAMEKAGGQMAAKQTAEAMKELSRLAQQAMDESKELAEGLSDELKEACQQGSLTPEQMRDLAEALKGCKACERGKLVKMIKAKLIDAGELELLDKACECDPDALAELLCQCKDGKQLAEALACCDGDGLPGRGGITRGRGDAAMTWSEGAKKEDAAFKEKLLPPSAVNSLKQSRLAGMSIANPKSAKSSGGSVGGALSTAAAGGGEAQSQIILPEHEKAVQRYFEREKK